jgi:hypothetical protein
MTKAWQGSLKSVSRMDPSRLQIQPIAHPVIKITTELVLYKGQTPMASTSRLPGSTVGKSLYWSLFEVLTLFGRYAPHDTAHLVKLMGGNVRRLGSESLSPS